MNRHAANSPQVSPTPRLAGRYELAEIIYSDPAVVAYRAHDQLLNRTVTVELLQAQMATNPAYIQRLLDKARRAAMVSLPYVATLYDQGAIDDRPFLVLEEVLGPPLAEAAPLSPDQAIDSLALVGDTVRAALTQGQPLPTINAETVRITTEGRVQIIDLGLVEPPSSDNAVAILGHLLNVALAGSTETHRAIPLTAIAERAETGGYVSIDDFIADLRHTQQQANTPTTVLPRVPPTIAIDDAPEREPAEAPSLPQREPNRRPRRGKVGRWEGGKVRQPQLEPNRRPRHLVWGLIGVGAVLALLLIGGSLLRRGGDQTAKEPAASTSPSPLASGTTASAAASSAPAGPQYVVAAKNSTTVWVRSGPGLNFAQVASLPNGTVVSVIDGPRPADNYNWVHIRADGVDGWSILEALQKR